MLEGGLVELYSYENDQLTIGSEITFYSNSAFTKLGPFPEYGANPSTLFLLVAFSCYSSTTKNAKSSTQGYPLRKFKLKVKHTLSVYTSPLTVILS